MFFDNELHSLFSLFAFILVKVQCNVDVSNNSNVDLSRLNKTVHCKFQPNSFVCTPRKKTPNNVCPLIRNWKFIGCITCITVKLLPASETGLRTYNNIEYLYTAIILRYYFDVLLNRCVRFEYADCNHSYNMFDRRRLCLDACRDDAYVQLPENLPEVIYCRYQPDFGDCNSYHPSWYYDITDMRCKGFSYSGCGGNRNRFSTAMECADICGTALTIYS